MQSIGNFLSKQLSPPSSHLQSNRKEVNKKGGLGGGTQVIYDFNNPGSCKPASDSCSCQAHEDKRPLNCGVCGPRWAPSTVYRPGKAVKAM